MKELKSDVFTGFKDSIFCQSVKSNLITECPCVRIIYQKDSLRTDLKRLEGQ